MMLARIKSLFPERPKVSYAQCGEDLIVQYIFKALGITRPTYLDIGAHHPTYMSNTFLFYRQGGQGVCVEPDPVLSARIKRKRPRDTCLNVGVGISTSATAKFYVMTSKSLSTFSDQEAERYQSYGKQRIEKIIQTPLFSINDVIKQYFVLSPQFISIDVEGLDLDILKSLDFKQFRPIVLCVETLTYTEDRTERKLPEAIDFVCNQGYLLYADTFINSIFVDRSMWSNRP